MLTSCPMACVQAFKKEAGYQARAEHPNVLSLFAWDRNDKGVLRLIMELAHGGSLFYHMWCDPVYFQTSVYFNSIHMNHPPLVPCFVVWLRHMH